MEISSSTLPHLKTLLNATSKAVRVECQFNFLKSCVEARRVPDGIISQCAFKSSIQDPNLQLLLNNMMNFTASRIMDTLITYYCNWKNDLWKTYYSNLAKLKTSLTTDDYNKTSEILHKRIRNDKIKHEKTHKSKADRDAKKYPEQTYIPNVSYTAKTTRTSKHTRLRRLTKKHHPQKPKRKRSTRVSAPKKQRKYLRNDKSTSHEEVPEEELKKSVINLSSKILTKEHLFVFHLGGSFAPTPKLPNLMQFKDDVSTWISKLRTAYNMSTMLKDVQALKPRPDVSNMSSDIAKMESAIIPPPQRNAAITVSETKGHALEMFISKINEEIRNFSSKRKVANPSNIDKKTQDAIKELKSWKDDVLIRVYDKGKGFFLLDKQYYINRTMQTINCCMD